MDSELEGNLVDAIAALSKDKRELEERIEEINSMLLRRQENLGKVLKKNDQLEDELREMEKRTVALQNIIKDQEDTIERMEKERLKE